MKKLAYIINICLVMLLIFSMPLTAWAKEEKEFLFELESTQNMSVSITYDKKEPAFSLVDEEGNEYSETNKNIRVERFDKAVVCYIDRAAAGKWYLKYDKGSNTELEVSYAPFAELPVIERFNVGYDENSNFQASFKISGSESANGSFKLWAVVLDESGSVSGQRLLEEGGCNLNDENTVGVDIESLGSFDKYRFMLEVCADTNGIEATAQALTDKDFAYTNKNSLDPITEMYIEYDIDNQTIYADWSEHAVSGADDYVFAVFAEDKDGEPVYANTFESDITETATAVEGEHVAVFYVNLYYRERGQLSQVLERKIDLNKNKMVIDTPEVTNSIFAEVTNDADDARKVIVIRGEQSEEVSMAPKQTISVNLEETGNNVSVLYNLEHETYILKNLDIFVDTKAPVLNIYENDIRLDSTQDTFKIAGVTEIGAVVCVDGTEISTEDDGSFVCNVKVPEGSHQIEVTAEDAAGNVALQTVNITRDLFGKDHNKTDALKFSKYMPIIISMAAALMFMLIILMMSRSYRKNKERYGRGIAVLSAVDLLLLIVTIICFLICVYLGIMTFKSYHLISDKSFIDAVIESSQNAYSYVLDFTQYRKKLILMSLPVLAGLTMTIVLKVLIVHFRQRKNNK